MAVFWKKKARTKRVALDKARSTREPYDFFDERRLGTLLIMLLFYVLVILIVNQGEPPINIGKDEVAKKTYVARRKFECRDLEGTEAARWKARDEEPNYYINDLSEIDDAKENVLRILNKALNIKGDLHEISEHASKELEIDPARLEKLFTELRANKAAPKSESGEPASQQANANNSSPTAKPDANTTLVAKIDAIFNRLRDDDRVKNIGIIKESDYKREKTRAIKVFDKKSNKFVPKDIYYLKRQKNYIREEVIRPEIDDKFSGFSEDARAVLADILDKEFDGTLSFDSQKTEDAKRNAYNSVKEQKKEIEEGQILLSQGKQATRQDIIEIKAEQKAYLKSLSSEELSIIHLKRLAGVTLTVTIFFVICTVYTRKFQPILIRSRTRLFMFGCTCLFVLGIAKLFVKVGLSPYLIPVCLASTILTIVYGQRFSLGITIMLTMLVGIIVGANYSVLIVLGFGAAISTFAVSSVKDRLELIKAGTITGMVHICCIWGMGLLSGTNVTIRFWESSLFYDSLCGLGNGMAVGFLISGILPFVERVFNTVTDVSLREWADQDKPMMRILGLNASGTYHHSLIVGNLAETAAEAIGANSLLAKVGGLYHDIGKLNKPEYFIENQERDNIHDKLSPVLSALIITAHTKDGIELAEEYNLPPQVKDIVEQHHGTTLVEYFYKRAMTQAKGGEEISPDSFRHRGPKPKTKEAAIVMLADSVESAVRALSNPTPARIRNSVHKVIQNRLTDAQLDDCDITLKEVSKVEESLVRGLTALHHGRVKYPETQNNGKSQPNPQKQKSDKREPAQIY